MIPRRNTAAARLAALLDALETDLLGASPDDVQASLRETGRARESAVREIRSLLRDAETQGHDHYPLDLPVDERDRINTQRH
jgi:hypothetical protein